MVQGASSAWDGLQGVMMQPLTQPQPQPVLQVQEYDLPNCFGVGQESSLMDILEIAGSQLDFEAGFTNENIKADYGGKRSSDPKKKQKEQPIGSSSSVDALSKMMADVSVGGSSGNGNGRNAPSQRPEGQSQQRLSRDADVAFRVAVSAAECLQAYAATGDISLLLATHRYLLAVQNNQGDTALHTAVSNKNMEAFNKILKASEKINPRDLLNAQNFAHETALHQAIRGNELTMVRRLVATPGCNVSLVDSQGNTPIHSAASLQDPQCLDALLTQPINGARSALTQAINIYNYQGETPLHVAVVSGSLECVRRLVEAGAQVHHCERKRGANPLHLAAMFGRRDIAAFLIDHTSVTVEAAMFDGNTALHLAAQSRDAELCRLLMRAKADPQVRNALSRRKKSSESEEEEDEVDEEEEEDSEEEQQGYTPLDYAGDDEEILAILHGEEPVEVQAAGEVLVQEGKKEAPQHSALDSGIDISVTDIQSSELACDESQESARELNERTRGRLASLLSGDTWQHLAQLLDLEFLVPCLAKEATPAHVLLQPENMKGVSMEKLRECLEVLGLKNCVAVLDQA